MDEDIFQGRLADRDGLDLAREGLDHVGDEAMSAFEFDANLVAQHGGLNVEALANLLGERGGIACGIFYVLYETLEGYVIYPRVMRSSIDVPEYHP